MTSSAPGSTPNTSAPARTGPSASSSPSCSAASASITSIYVATASASSTSSSSGPAFPPFSASSNVSSCRAASASTTPRRRTTSPAKSSAPLQLSVTQPSTRNLGLHPLRLGAARAATLSIQPPPSALTAEPQSPTPQSTPRQHSSPRSIPVFQLKPGIFTSTRSGPQLHRGS